MYTHTQYIKSTVIIAVTICMRPIEASAIDQIDATTQRHALVYGDDSRVEARLHNNSLFRKLARQSVVSIVPKNRLSITGDFVEYRAEPLGAAGDICADAPFSSQPSLSECSGVLVDDDLVLTAAHCVNMDGACDNNYFVLDYTLDQNGEVRLDPTKIYECKQVVCSELSHFSAPEVYDYAVVQLDRSTSGLGLPVPVSDERVTLGQQVALIGNGLGLPTKVDDQGEIFFEGGFDNDYFGFQADLFHKGSGSPVFDASGRLVGIAVRGGVDFTDNGACMAVRMLQKGAPYHEEASYAGEALKRAGLSYILAQHRDLGIDGLSDSASCSAVLYNTKKISALMHFMLTLIGLD